MAIERALEAYGYEDFAFTWEYAPQTTIADFDLIFELLSDWDETPLVSRTVGSGITLSAAPLLYQATITLSSSNLGRAAGDYVYTISKRPSGAKRVLSFGPFIILEPRVGGN